MLWFNKNNKPENIELTAHRIINASSPFAIREAFSALCTNILYLPIEDKCKKIVITSAFSGEGKTYTATNLAITLAKNLSDKKILLIDLDMRSPSATRFINTLYPESKGTSGLSEYLAGLSDVPEFINTEYKNLSVLLAGAESTNPAGLINSSRMTELLNKVNESYDYVIIDTPPVTVVSDATLLVGKVNGYIIATRADYSNVNSVSEAIDILEGVGAQIFGTVLCDLNLKKNGRYGKYGKYGKYDKYAKYGK